MNSGSAQGYKPPHGGRPGTLTPSVITCQGCGDELDPNRESLHQCADCGRMVCNWCLGHGIHSLKRSTR
jgi:hypothetical protein